jgi:NitT/TauT family transport system substrate-binding protein
LLLIVAAAMVACSAAGAQSGSGTGPSAPEVVRLGLFPNVTHATAMVGVESGMFAKSLGPGTRLETVTFNAGPAAVEALFAGGIDATYIGPNPALTAYFRSRGQAIRIIAGATSGGASLVVRPSIKGPSDLAGKRIASPQLGNTQDVALRVWMGQQGLKTEATGAGDVAVLPQDNAQTLEAFRSGQIDGAWVPEPWASRLVLEAGGTILLDERDLWPGRQFVTTLLVARTDFLRDYPQTAEALVRGHVEATEYLGREPAASQSLVNGFLQRITGRGLGDEILAAAWQNLSFTNDPLAASLRKSASDAESLGFLNASGTSLDNIYDLRFLNNVLAANGSPEVKAP